MPSSRRRASASHAGTIRGSPYGGDHSTSRVDGPWRGSKKQGGRRSGGVSPAKRAFAEAIAQRPSSSASPTGARSCGCRARSHCSSASVYRATAWS